jgi:hypothetical protein
MGRAVGGTSDSKAVGLWETNGFAFVPHMCRFLGQQSLGCRTGGEVLVMRDLDLRKRAGTSTVAR